MNLGLTQHPKQSNNFCWKDGENWGEGLAVSFLLYDHPQTDTSNGLFQKQQGLVEACPHTARTSKPDGQNTSNLVSDLGCYDRESQTSLLKCERFIFRDSSDKTAGRACVL